MTGVVPGWEHFAVPRFVEKVVLTVRIMACVMFIAASGVHTVAGAMLQGCWVGGPVCCMPGWSRSPEEWMKANLFRYEPRGSTDWMILGRPGPSQSQFLHL